MKFRYPHHDFWIESAWKNSRPLSKVEKKGIPNIISNTTHFYHNQKQSWYLCRRPYRLQSQFWDVLQPKIHQYLPSTPPRNILPEVWCTQKLFHHQQTVHGISQIVYPWLSRRCACLQTWIQPWNNHNFDLKLYSHVSKLYKNKTSSPYLSLSCIHV